MKLFRSHLQVCSSRVALLMACVAPLAIAAPAAAQAQSADEARSYAIPAGPLSQALQAYSAETGVQLVYSSALVEGLQSPGVSGRMSRAQALAALLAGTGLVGNLSGNTATISASAGTTEDGERVTSAVRVEGVQGSPYFGGAGVAAGVNGVNGSRDITATEGTGSFTSGALTIGSKVAQSIQDVPQSVSVLTSERMEQQNVTDFTTAMQQLPGITLVQGSSSLETNFYSRGFSVSNIQIDGGPPLSTSFGFYPQIDMSIYDHVEILRGSAGTFNGYGDPGGTVNLVRKKPLDHAQVLLEAQAGSWSNYRVVLDATSPLALDGRLRGRMVMTWQDMNHFYDVAEDSKEIVYGILQFDATPTTLLTLGGSYTNQNSTPWYNGLPRYQTGEDLNLPRSTALAFPWNRWDFSTTEIFGGVEQRFGEDWSLKVNLTYNDQDSTRKIGYSNGAVNPLTDAGPRLYGQYRLYSSEQFLVEGVLTGAFDLFGQRQELVIGINHSNTDSSGQTNYANMITSSSAAPYQPYPGGPLFCTNVSICSAGIATPPINVFAFDPSNPLYTEPRNPLAQLYFREYGQSQTIAYANLRLTAFDRLHLMTGLRWSHYESKSVTDALCTSTTAWGCTGLAVGDVYSSSDASYSGSDFSWPPSVNLSFDVLPELTAYVGYNDIYVDQSSLIDANGNTLDPATGFTWEAGLKWAARDGRLNATLSFYQTKQNGLSVMDDTQPYTDLGNGTSCCYLNDPNQTKKSSGIDFELTGEILPGFQAALSYSYNQNSYEGSTYTNAGSALLSIQPKSLYKIWLSYDFGRAGFDGMLSNLTLSGGVNGQSSGYYAGYACYQDYLVTNSVTGIATCASGGSYQYDFVVPAHAILAARVDYRLSESLSVSVNMDNILDKTYYQTVGTVDGGNWYGAPRSVMFSLRGRW